MPALTPAQNFYLRLLAHDPDEAAAQAEFLMKDRPLGDYYDAEPAPPPSYRPNGLDWNAAARWGAATETGGLPSCTYRSHG